MFETTRIPPVVPCLGNPDALTWVLTAVEEPREISAAM
jgi:hypothetical protein